MSYYGNEVPIEELIGKTMKSVRLIGDEISFEADDGTEYKLYHSQDCCENVYVDSIVGDLSDLENSPILIAEEISNEGSPTKDPYDQMYGSYTWTFYKFSTRKGYVDIRWYGSSNGYYSEKVDFVRI